MIIHVFQNRPPTSHCFSNTKGYNSQTYCSNWSDDRRPYIWSRNCKIGFLQTNASYKIFLNTVLHFRSSFITSNLALCLKNSSEDINLPVMSTSNRCVLLYRPAISPDELITKCVLYSLLPSKPSFG